MSEKKPRGVEIIENMSNDEFYHKVIRRIAHREEIGELVLGYCRDVSPEIREAARNALVEIGIPRFLTESDEDLDYITAVIGSRIVSPHNVGRTTNRGEKIITVSNGGNEMEFVIKEHEDHIVLVSYLTRDLPNISIPEEIERKPVTAIGEDCFFTCMEIESIRLPQTIESIGAEAFGLCRRLTEINLPDSITKIGGWAFRDCKSLKKVILPKNLKRIEEALFAYSRVSEIILPDGLEVIEPYAFSNAGIFDLVIPESVKEIGFAAFWRGPNPITSLPEDEAWYRSWPYGESVISHGSQGKITDYRYLEEGCEMHEATFGSEKKQFAYPCDYLDGNISFLDEENKQHLQRDVKRNWDSEEKLENAYKITRAWRRGLI